MIDKLKEFLKFKENDEVEKINVFEAKKLFKWFFELYSWYINRKIVILFEKEKIKLLKLDDSLHNQYKEVLSEDLLSISKGYTVLYYTANVDFNITGGVLNSINENHSFTDKDIKLSHYVSLYNNIYLNLHTKSTFKHTNSNSNRYFSAYDSEKEVLNIKIKNNETIAQLFTLFDYDYLKDSMFEISRAINSCGIISVHGLNSIDFKNNNDNSKIFKYYLKINENTICLNFDNIDLLIEFLSIHIRKLVKSQFHKSSMVVFSTNVDNNRNITEINKLLNTFKDCELQSLETYNDNSRNDIVTKIYDHREFIKI